MVSTSDNAPASIPKRRKLTFQDAEAIAKLVCKSKLTETEACHILDILPQQWFIFKQRKAVAPKFERLISRIRGFAIETAMQTIEDCGNGVGMKQPDWRAHAFRLSVIAPERFAPQRAGNEAQTQSTASTAVLEALLAMSTKVFALPANEPTRQLADAKTPQDSTNQVIDIQPVVVPDNSPK